MRLHPEKRACPRRGNTPTVKAVLDRHQSERGGKGCWDTEQLDRDWASSFRVRIASEPPCPREARVRALRTGEDHVRGVWRSCGGRRQAHINALVSHELETGAPVFSAAGVAPEQGGGTNEARMKKHTHLARLCCGVAIPLTLLAQWTRTAIADAGCIHDAQAPVDAPFVAPGHEAHVLLDTGASHQAGEESLVPRSDLFSEAGGGSGWFIPSGGSG
jgi:hypothetical protein